MKSCFALVLFFALKGVDASAIADVVSNYAKVVVNDGNDHKGNATNTTAVTTSTVKPTPRNETEDDEEIPNYDDFDDMSATERSHTVYDSQTMMKYFSGVVSLLSLMSQFGDPPKKPEKMYPRNSGGDSLADSVNKLAEGRYIPNTATKMFKYGGYPPLNKVPVYNTPSAGSDTYDNSGKTSYDSDSSQYMIKNPESVQSKPFSADDAMYKEKSPMTDYMSQNSAVEIQPSYSYEITEAPKKMKTEESDSWSAGQNNDPYSSWNSKPEEPKEKPAPVYYPWQNKAKKVMPPMEEPGDDHADMPPSDPHPSWNMDIPTKPKYKPKPPPMEDEPAEDDLPPAWNAPSKPYKPQPPPMEEPEDDDLPPPKSYGSSKAKHRPQPEEYYYSYPSHPKKMKPPPPEEDEPEDDYGMRPPINSKPPKSKGPPPDDHHNFDGLLYNEHDNDHGIVYHDHHDFHDEPEHDMKDEDRESKRPYTYYHLGRKLWYVPLLFSLYFIVYVGSLVLKSIARHKVQFPEKLWELHEHEHHHGDHGRSSRHLYDLTKHVLSNITKAENKYM